MLINSEVHYALLLMEHMVNAGYNVLVTRKEVSDEKGIPSHFLAKIAQNLAKNKFIEIRQGSKGGYILTCDPGGVTIGDVIDGIRGNTDVCPKAVNGQKIEGKLGQIYANINAQVYRVTCDVLLSDFAE